jgi:hypothetical protein
MMLDIESFILRETNMNEKRPMGVREQIFAFEENTKHLS